MSDYSSFDAFTPAGSGRLTAVLGPTNTGKTHYAIERMLARRSGMIGLPLRLLAREIYDRVVAKVGARNVALVTGEEKIIPPSARYWIATVEAMPLERDVEFMAIDEIQLAADPERGRIFTSRLLHARGSDETLLLGSDTMRPILQRLFRDIQFLARERFSRLTYSGSKKVTRLPRRTAIVGFSSDTVYAVAELIRRQRGGAAVVLGALSPRTRNAQAELYQNGDVDFLVATDAIGMGLNMDIDHVAFSASRKFDGRRSRNLTHGEIGQIAGRAGRHVNDGTFGTTADCPPFDEEAIEAIENHQFEAVKALQWRTERIDLSSLPALMNSLETPPTRPEFIRSRREDDEDALMRLSRDDDIRAIATGGAALATLWDICQTPDFRKLGGDQHARLLADIYMMLARDGRIDDDWFGERVARLDRSDGDIDALSTRLAYMRTWTYLSHRAAWLERAPYWQERTRAIEDTLSDALHEKLTQRFVDRRTSALLKRLNGDTPVLAGVTDDGEVIVEGQFIGRLLGFEFIIDPRASGAEAKSIRAAAEKALRPVLAARAGALANAEPHELSLKDDGSIWWRSAHVATLKKGPAPLRPELVISGLDDITPNMRGRVEDRLKDFVAHKIEALLGPLVSLQAAANGAGEDALQGIAKGVAYRLVENFGATSRTMFGDELKQVGQDERGKMRRLGMRFGEYTLYIPALLKPAPAGLLLQLWALWTDRKPGDVPAPKAGLVSIEMAEDLPHAYYYAAGYRPSGKRAVRIDMLERLAGLIRTARNEANMREGFAATPQMMSLVGCSGEDFEAILRSLGLRKHTVKRKAAAQAAAPHATATATETAAEAAPVLEAPAAPETNDPVVTAPANPAPIESPEESPTPEASADAPTSPAEAAPEETPATEPAPAAETVAAEAAAAAPAAQADEAAAPSDAADVEIELWRPAPRKARKEFTRKGKEGDRSGAKKAGGKPRGKERGQDRGKDRPADRGQNRNKQRGPKNASAGKPRPPRERKPDPNSPFAVLAGLKSELSANKGGGGKNNKNGAKASENAE